MLTFSRQLIAIGLAIFLSAGNLAVCAGWAPTPEARMACCIEGGSCPMHASENDSGSRQPLTQAQADTCCASSERNNSGQPSSISLAAISSAVLGASTILPAGLPALVVSDGWRRTTPIPTPPVPKHVLLSVFLV